MVFLASGVYNLDSSLMSSATTCRLNEIQNAGPKLDASSSPTTGKKREPDPNGTDADADGERSDHPPTMMHDVVAPDGPDRKHQARQEPQAEHHRGRCLR